MTKNKGYTLVEMVIVIVIMAVLSGGAFLTFHIIKESKRQTATNTMDNQIGSCLIQTKAVSEAKNANNPLCMVIRKRSDGAYAIMTGYINGASITDSAGNPLDPDDNEKCEVVLSKEIANIEYEPSDTSQVFSAGDMVIQFIKSDGSTQYGAGAYRLYEKRTGDLYSTIYLDAVSGKHYVK